jgi:hypothetical protein
MDIASGLYTDTGLVIKIPYTTFETSLKLNK